MKRRLNFISMDARDVRARLRNILEAIAVFEPRHVVRGTGSDDAIVPRAPFRVHVDTRDPARRRRRSAARGRSAVFGRVGRLRATRGGRGAFVRLRRSSLEVVIVRPYDDHSIAAPARFHRVGRSAAIYEHLEQDHDVDRYLDAAADDELHGRVT